MFLNLINLFPKDGFEVETYFLLSFPTRFEAKTTVFGFEVETYFLSFPTRFEAKTIVFEPYIFSQEAPILETSFHKIWIWSWNLFLTLDLKLKLISYLFPRGLKLRLLFSKLIFFAPKLVSWRFGFEWKLNLIWIFFF